MPGLGLGVGARHRRQGTPSGLFFAGEQGVWYDPGDLSTLFQDAAGTTPVTAVEQPVGLMLDKSKGLVLGPELVVNGNFDAASNWILASGWSISGGALVATNATSTVNAYQPISTKPAVLFQCTFTVTALSSGSVSLGLGPSLGAPRTTTGTFTEYLFGTSSANAVSVYQRTATALNCTIDNISVRELPGNHAFQTTSTSRPLLKQDAGGQYYLKFDGVDDFLVTNSIDFTATDKMTVFAGVRKLSDAAIGVVVESSANVGANPGDFVLGAPGSNGVADYSFVSKGTTASVIVPSGFSAPITNVLTGMGDISGDRATLRVNGTQAAQSTANQGTGNYGNYPLYIGRRGGTTLPFNGHIYSLIVRGAATTDTRIAQTERWVAKKTGVTL